MKRRDFLLLRTEGAIRVVELSCERLYMRYAESLATGGQRSMGADAGDVDPWEGEPPAVVGTPPPTELFRDVNRDLQDLSLIHI